MKEDIYEKWKSEDIQVKLICLGMVGLLIAILIPLFWVSTYNFKSVADLPYVQDVEIVWEESHSVLKILTAQVIDTWHNYLDWQGTYFSLWFFTSMIGIFGENAYYMGTVLSLGSFVLSELIFLMVVLVKGLGADKSRAAIVTLGCIGIQVLLTPYPVEAFFWFCGAILYTFIHALALLLVTLLFLLERYHNEKKGKTILLEIGILLLTIGVGGGNYITALLVMILYVLYVIWAFWRKNPCKVLMLSNALVYMVAFALNVLAPGNTVRQNASGLEHLPALESIFHSLKEAANYCMVNMNPPCVILGLLFVPIFVHIVKNKNYKYPLPLLVSILSFGIYAAQFTPTLYALHIIGAGRVQNLYRFNFYLLMYANELYWIGWLWRRWRENHVEESVLGDNKESRTSYLLLGWITGGILLCVSLVIWGGSTLTTVSAVQSLRRGEAQQYRQEYEERLILLEDNSIREIYLEPYSVKPYLLFFGDVAVDTDDWVNKAMAEYYDKEVVGLKE